MQSARAYIAPSPWPWPYTLRKRKYARAREKVGTRLHGTRIRVRELGAHAHMLVQFRAKRGLHVYEYNRKDLVLMPT